MNMQMLYKSVVTGRDYTTMVFDDYSFSLRAVG